MKSVSEENFKHNDQSHLKHLKLKGLQPKTIEAYSRAIRRIGAYFDHQIDALSAQQLTDHQWGHTSMAHIDGVRP